MTVLLVVTLVSLVLALVMSAIAWRVARDEGAREQARVSALAADIQTAVAAAGGRRAEPILRAVPAPLASSGELFATPVSGVSTRSFLGVGLGLVAFAVIAALAVVATYPTHTTHATHTTDPAHEAQPTLDLVALGHERDGDRLIVRGVVRNPSAVPAGTLTAVVLAFGRDGGFVTSGRAPLGAPRLAPGADSTFLVTVPHARDVVRYRVSFRTDATIVPHVDRRQRS